MNDFCLQKGIKREFSNARTPQQNGVSERRNRTLIEADRTMLADAKLPVTFWAEAVNTACYIQNRVLVNKSHNKTPYELFNGRSPAIGFLKPFGCHVMILNTLDNLGKFEGKRDEGTKDTASQEVTKDVSSLRYIALPNWAHDALLKFNSSKPQDHFSSKVPEGSGNTNPTASTPNPPADHMETLTVETPIPTVSSPVPTAYSTDSQDSSSDARLISKRVANQEETPSLDNILLLTNWFEDILGGITNSDESNGVEADVSNLETTITSSPTPTLRIHKNHSKSQIIGPVDTPIQTRNKSKEVGEQSFIATIHQKTDPALLQFCMFSCFLSQVEPKKISDPLQDPSWVEAMHEELLQFKIQKVWTLVDCPKGSAFLYGTIDEEVYVMQPPRFQDLEYPAKVYKVEKAMYGLHQAPRAWYALMHEKFQMSAMGELNFFLGLQVLPKKDGIFLSQDKYMGDILKKFGYPDVRSSNTPMDKENLWGKDGTGKM
nr:putative ribonuclease H-like domain-containing protein [Tanacetum cinerariifolium]